MILTNKDIGEFESALEHIYSRRKLQSNEFGAYFVGHERDLQFTSWLAEHPQVLMAGARLQEFVGSHKLPLYKQLVKQSILLGGKRPAFRNFNGQWIITTGGEDKNIQGYSLAGLEHALSCGEDDDRYEGLIDACLIDIGKAELVLKQAAKHVDSELLDPMTLVSPELWTPTKQANQKTILQRAATPLIHALQAETSDLGSLGWRQLEDIVAEILRASGMEIHEVRETPQGGRDIIARTELISGEVLTLAVEVKHRSVVDRPTLHTALHQNAHFPALMLVTSGRFTAGVIREAQKSQNRMRLFLKDGVAIRDMIKNYMPR